MTVRLKFHRVVRASLPINESVIPLSGEIIKDIFEGGDLGK